MAITRSGLVRAIITPLMWLVDLYSITQDTGKQIAWHLLTDEYKRATFTVVVGAAGAAANATSVPVDKLDGPLKKGTVLYFGAKKFAKLTADAPASATPVSITVEALATALVDNDEAVAFHEVGVGGTTGQNFNAYFIPNGTVMVEVAAEDYKLIPLALDDDSTEQVSILMSDANSDSKTDSLTGYGVTFDGVVYENLLPDAINNGGTLPTAIKSKMTRFIFRRAVDSRGA